MEQIKQEQEKEEEMDFEKIAGENLAKFKEAMDSQDLEKMLSFFANEFTFQPTRWNRIVRQLRGMEESDYSAEKYFRNFFEFSPIITVNDFVISSFGENLYLVTALDNFELTAKDGQRETGNYKFDQIWTLENGEWKMKHFLSAVSIDGH